MGVSPMNHAQEARATFQHLNNRSVVNTLAILALLLTVSVNPTRSQNESKPAGSNREGSPARIAFERFKKLAGEWTGKSTKGWQENIRYQIITGGTVVVETSFDAHPNETMMTMFHLDGDRLMLTHYCVAKNQPRLLATSFEDDGRKITFTFLDGTNMPSRDRGHMDKAVFRFVDDNHVSSQWTWYQDGKESWMEEITLERKL
jgi:hypothetical protein